MNTPNKEAGPPGRLARRAQPGQNRMPAGSVFYDRIIPIVIAGLAICTIVIILIAAGVLLGVVPFR